MSIRSPLRAPSQEHRRRSRGRGTVLAAAWARAVPLPGWPHPSAAWRGITTGCWLFWNCKANVKDPVTNLQLKITFFHLKCLQHPQSQDVAAISLPHTPSLLPPYASPSPVSRRQNKVTDHRQEFFPDLNGEGCRDSLSELHVACPASPPAHSGGQQNAPSASAPAAPTQPTTLPSSSAGASRALEPFFPPAAFYKLAPEVNYPICFEGPDSCPQGGM